MLQAVEKIENWGLDDESAENFSLSSSSPAVRTAVTFYSKILLNSRLFYSKHAKHVNKCNSFTVTYPDPL